MSSIPVRRRPRVRIAVLGETTTLIEPSSVVSVQTMKGLHEAAGVFDVALKSEPDQGVLRANALQRSPFSPMTDRWLELIRPMSIVYIAMGTDADLAVVDDVFQQIKGGALTPNTALTALTDDRRSAVQRAIVMVGIVESATTDILVSSGGVEKMFHMVGKDLTKLLLDDTLRLTLAPNETATSDTAVGTGSVWLGNPNGKPGLNRNDPEVQQFLTRLFLNNRKDWFPTVAQGNQALAALGDVIPKVVEIAPSQHVQLANKRPFRDYLPSVHVDPSLAGVRIQPYSHLYFFQGSTWEAINAIAPRPLAEVFVDTVGFGAELVVRRPPFVRPQLMQGADQALKKTLSQVSIPESTWSALWTEPLLGTTDVFTNAALRVVPTTANRAYHTIGASEIVSLQWLRSDADATTQYQVTSELVAQGPSLAQQFVVPIAVDVPQSMRFGTRPFQALNPWWADVPPGAAASPDGIPINYPYSFGLSCAELVRLYYYFRDNPEFYSGSLTIAGRPEIRVGDRIYFADFGVIAYVENVRQSWKVGTPFLTQVSLTRGQPKDPPSGTRLVPYDQDPPV